MLENVPMGTRRYKTSEKRRIIKRHQIAFRRWVQYQSGGGPIEKYIATDVWTVRRWIDERMTSGMNWNNYGAVWVIDHIVPLRMFNVFDEADLKIGWHYKNLMPLLVEDNLAKEGNVFYAFVLLSKIKGNDYYFNKLYERILPEVDTMNKYIQTYCDNHISEPEQKTA